MSTNWLHHRSDQPEEEQAMADFTGQKIVVIGGSSGMGRDTAADVVGAGGSAVKTSNASRTRSRNCPRTARPVASPRN